MPSSSAVFAVPPPLLCGNVVCLVPPVRSLRAIVLPLFIDASRVENASSSSLHKAEPRLSPG